jgi:hypothetical protein
MAIYQFGSHFTFTNVPRGTTPQGVPGATQPNAHISPYAPGISQLSHIEQGRVPNTWEEHRVDSSDVEGFISPGFRYLDSAMKNYWADIRVPTKDAYRFIRTKIAGMSRSLQIWNEEMKHGRVKLPVISISRTGQDFNYEKFTPPYYPLRRRYVNRAKTRVALAYRPVPYFVEYTLNIWAEHKRDAEYISYQILTRFNSLAELTVSDEHSYGNVQMKFKSSTDASDKEATAEQYAKVKYEVAYTAEAWLSLPEKVMPTIVGLVQATELI